MVTAGIIAEYNPLHRGHAFLIEELKRRGADGIAVVLSGNFVQRGDAAVLSKWARTKQALACGADLVLELPLPWAVSGAEHFALGGIAVLAALGADSVGFGSECGDLKQLQKAREALASPLLHSAMEEALQSGRTFAAARQKAVGSLFGEQTAALLREPNNVLGIEYLKAIETLKANLSPFTVRRIATEHGSGLARGENASSAAIRKLLERGKDVSPFLSPDAYRILKDEMACGRAPADLNRLERGILASLRKMSRKDFSLLPDISEGLENRIYASARTAGSLSELYFSAKSKRYTLARIRRIVLSAFLGMDASYGAGTPPYLRVLGIGPRGPEILKKAKKKALLPIVGRHADVVPLGTGARRIFALESRATDLYALCMPKPASCGLEQTSKIVVS